MRTALRHSRSALPVRSSTTDWSPVGLDDDPTPGDTEAVDRQAKEFETTAEWMWWRADRLDDVLERVREPHWSGYAAEAFGERLRTVSRACRDTSARFMEAREATLKWVVALWGEQDAADAALDAAGQALEDIERAEATLGLLLKPETLAALLAADPKLAQRFWDNPPPPEKVAAWWKKLPPEARERWCQSAPEVIGNLPGLDADTRIHANAIRLARDLTDPAISPDSARGRTLKDILAALGVEKLRDGTAADYERLAKAQKPPRGLLSYNLRHEPPLAAVAIGDTDAEKSGKVTWMVPGMDSGLGEDGRLRGWTDAGLNLHNEQGILDGLSHMVVAWIGYDAPGMDSVLHGDKARSGGRRLSAELDGQWAADSILGGNPDPYTAVVAHSYGTTVASKAIGGLGHNVQSVVFLASAGVEGGFASARDLRVDGGMQHVYASESSQDGIAGSGRAYSGRVDPRDHRYGSQVFSSEGDAAHRLEPTDGHDAVGYGDDRGAFNLHATSGHGYLNKGTESLRNTAAAALGEGGRINGGTRSIPRTHPSGVQHEPEGGGQ